MPAHLSALPDGHDDHEALAAIEELIAEFDAPAIVSACLRSTAGEQFQFNNNAALRISQVILREIAFARNPQLEAEVMALGLGIILDDKDTMSAIARKHGLTKQALSQRVIKFCDTNKLPPSQYMLSKKNRATYALTNQPRIA